MGTTLDIWKGVGDRLLSYGVLRQDGQFFSSMFEEWIWEHGDEI